MKTYDVKIVVTVRAGSPSMARQLAGEVVDKVNILSGVRARLTGDDPKVSGQ